jgi:class 3 adenylate cyclase
MPILRYSIEVIERHEIEKIKTIGDAYVCAGGVPVKNEGNPFEVVKAALEMVEEIQKLDKKRLAEGKKCFLVPHWYSHRAASGGHYWVA